MGGGQLYSRRLTWLRREGDGAGIIRLSADVTEFHAAIAAKRHIKWRRRRRTSPAQRYYITSEGESPQPVREASAGPGQNPGSPGPTGPAAASTLTPVRACQPSGIQPPAAHVAQKQKKSPDFSGDFFIGFRLRYPQYPVCLHHQDRDKPLLLHVRHK